MTRDEYQLLASAQVTSIQYGTKWEVSISLGNFETMLVMDDCDYASDKWVAQMKKMHDIAYEQLVVYLGEHDGA